MNIKSQKDFFSGLFYLVAGGAFAIGATNYNVGTGARMGPGYFPLLLGILLAIIGAFIMFKSLTVETQDGEKIGKWAWKPLFFIIVGNLLFGILLGGLPSIGVPATGSLPHFFALMVGQAAQVPTQVVGYKGSAPLGNDLMGGHVPVAIDTLDTLLPLHEGGKLRIHIRGRPDTLEVSRMYAHRFKAM